MNFADTAVLILLALADIALLTHMRRARRRRMRDQRMMRCLKLAIQREIKAQLLAPPAKPWALRRAG